jgi:hypothetical protein
MKIDYLGKRRTHPNYLEEWKVSVHIIEKDSHIGRQREIGASEI